MNQNRLLDFISKKFEIIIFLIFCVLTIFLSFFHEPWFDEFQAWGIAKESLYNILFVIPHSEGHPSLWHLILKFFQIFTSNPELVIKIPNLAIMFCAVYLLIFKSPFPKIIKYTLPFTYFIFYQYSIISRPYCIFTFAIFLIAMLYKSRNEHPFKFVFAMILLSLSSAYGVVISTGITIAWFLEIIDIKSVKDIKNNLIKFFKDKRFYAMIIIFVECLILTIQCFPSQKHKLIYPFMYVPLFWEKIYCLFGTIADATAFNILNYEDFAQIGNYYTFGLGCLFGLFLWILLFRIFKANKILTLFICTFIPIIYCFSLYCWPHHFGIIFVLLIFYFWCLFDNPKIKENYRFPKEFKYVLLFVIITQIYWSMAAFANEILCDYAPSRAVANYIKENHLEKYNITTQWNPNNTKGHIWAIIISPYFKERIFYNFSVDRPQTRYNRSGEETPQHIEQIYKKWNELGLPDIFVDDVLVSMAWKTYLPNLKVLKSFNYGFVYKDMATKRVLNIYIDPKRWNKK